MCGELRSDCLIQPAQVRPECADAHSNQSSLRASRKGRLHFS